MIKRIYLDNAATSWPKPESVYQAVDRYQRENGAALGRGATQWSTEVSRTFQQTRLQLARLIGANEANRIVFSLNGTDSLNLSIHGVLQAGDHVITSCAEHNSVLRPLHHMENESGVSVTRLPVDAHGFYDPDELRSAIGSSTKLVALTHASNVTGCIQPAGEIGKICRDHDLLFLLDAAQTVGHLELDVEKLQVDLLAAPGHKGLLGPLGSGILYVGPRAEAKIRPIRQGGTGTLSESATQPHGLPERLECGNHNVPGIIGLSAGLEYLHNRGINAIHQHEVELTDRLYEMLADQGDVSIQSPAESRVGLISLTHDQFDPHDLATIMESSVGVSSRAGLHCAPLIHQSIGTFDRGGSLRLSVGPFNTEQDIETAGQFLLGLS